MNGLSRRLVAELLGTGLLVTAVVGSGIAAQRLSMDGGLRLLENTVATALALGVLILVLGPVSGAHFNPVVTVVAWLSTRERREPAVVPLAYIGAQLVGGIGGAMLANVMFGLSAVSWSTTHRSGTPVLVGEVVATAGLVLVVFALTRTGRLAAIPVAVAAYIGAAYWFTSSTSFANPAVAVGRMFSNTFAGIAPASVPAFIAVELVGAAVGAVVVSVLYPRSRSVAEVDALVLNAERG
jgi:glycerol uptake facilitator-like aquaporin